MRDTFSAFYKPTDEEFKELWDKCLFVPDANVLLNLYRYSQPTKDEFIEIFYQLASRIWLPYQVALEYHRNRPNVIVEQINRADQLLKNIEGRKNELTSDLLKLKKHPFIEADAIISKIETLFEELGKDIEAKKTQHPDLLAEDNIREKLGGLFSGKIGSNYSNEKLDEIYKDGKKRYGLMTPPGYLDKDKNEPDRYGDLIVWNQIIDRSKDGHVPIIFITDDTKEDWWLKLKNGQILSPRPELLQEMKQECQTSFYMYTADRFIKYAQQYLKRPINEGSIVEAESIRKNEDRLIRFRNTLGKITGASIDNNKIINYDLINEIKDRYQAYADILGQKTLTSVDEINRQLGLDKAGVDLARKTIDAINDEKTLQGILDDQRKIELYLENKIDRRTQDEMIAALSEILGK